MRTVDVFMPGHHVSDFPIGKAVLAVNGEPAGEVVAAEQSGQGVLVRMELFPTVMRLLEADIDGRHYEFGR